MDMTEISSDNVDKILPPGKLITTGGLISIVSVSTLLITIFINVLTAKFFGASGELDAFIVALSIPMLLMTLPFLGGVQTFLIPKFIKIKENASEDDAWKFFNSFATMVLSFGLLVTMAGVLSSRFLIAALAPGMEPEYVQFATRLLLVLQGTILINLLLNLSNGLLYVYKHFYLPSLAPFIVGIANLILFFMIKDRIGIWILVVITLNNLFVLLLGVSVYWKEIFSHCRFRFRMDYSLARSLVIPLLSLSAIGLFNRLNLVIDRYFASGLGTGQIAIYDYASKLVPVIISILVVTLLKPMYAYLSEASSKREYGPELKQNFLNSWRMTLLIFVPIAFLFLSLRTPIFSVLYEYGKFTRENVEEVSQVFLFLSLALLFWGLRHPMMLAYCAMDLNHLLGIFMVLGVVLNVLLDCIFIGPFGLVGLAAASSISALCGWMLMTYYLKKKIHYTFNELLVPFIKVLFCSAGVFAAGRFVFDMTWRFFGGSRISVLMCLGVSSLTAMVTCYLLYLLVRIPEARKLKTMLTFHR